MAIPLEIDIKTGEIKSPYGDLFFNFDVDQFSIVGIEISEPNRRQGIGTGLVNAAEKLARELECLKVEVPATPSRMAISFWNKNGYEFALKEEKALVARIMKSKSSSKIFDSDSGIVLMHKRIR